MAIAFPKSIFLLSFVIFHIAVNEGKRVWLVVLAMCVAATRGALIVKLAPRAPLAAAAPPIAQAARMGVLLARQALLAYKTVEIFVNRTSTLDE